MPQTVPEVWAGESTETTLLSRPSRRVTASPTRKEPRSLTA